jgi:hypothetical protein
MRQLFLTWHDWFASTDVKYEPNTLKRRYKTSPRYHSPPNVDLETSDVTCQKSFESWTFPE